MSKQPDQPAPKTEQPVLKKRMIPTQKTFGFPFFTPCFIIDWYVNRWLRSLVENQGVVPMKGDSVGGTFMIHQSYIYTKTITENEKTSLQGSSKP